MKIRGLVMLAVVAGAVAWPGAARAEVVGVPVFGAGSNWAQPAVRTWILQAAPRAGYADVGSTTGRQQFAAGAVDFAVSETPYGFDGVDQAPARPFAYVPVAGGGLAFVYNLTVDGRRVTDLRLSSGTITGIFTGDITRWDDPRVTAENPAIRLPARAIRPVVREDRAGTTAAFTGWMSERHPDRWDAYCQAHGRPSPCGATLTFPVGGQVARVGSTGVAGTVVQPGGDGMIGYVEHLYARANRLPVAKVRNQAGYYIAPTASAVGVALSGAGQDRRAYPVSSYASLIVPTTTEAGFTVERGLTLSEFGRYALCRGQRDVEFLGFAPLPVNLVRPGLEQLQRIPGAITRADPLAGCANPTFAADGTDTLPATAPQPPECDNQASGTQCVTASPAAPHAQTVDADVATGVFSLAVEDDVAVLTGGSVGGEAIGGLPAVTVTDLRGTNPGWNVTAQVEDFVHSARPDATIPGAQLGWDPAAEDGGGSGHAAAGVRVVPGSGGLAGGATLCAAPAGGSAGTFHCFATLILAVPDSTLPGTYAATLTLTLA
ncbi:substrate-binding domain-containing protein [Dactylosporangium sp. NPDC006015]|uniref:substrate-binding domain-containing protein n=1 Tax=Dactylosporangium sp. NPDC006015 TaxID=3154576 RepID=UPI0033B138AF